MTIRHRRTARFAVGAILVLLALVRAGAASPVTALLPISAAVCAAMFETPVAAALFGLLAGMLWDLNALTRDGVFALYLGVAGALVSLAATYYLRRRVLSALAASAVFLLPAAAALSLRGAGGLGAALRVFAVYYLPAVLSAAVFAFMLFYLFRAVYAAGSDARVRRGRR